MITEILAQIHGANFTAGIVLFDDKVVETAPIVRNMRGWSRDRVQAHCAKMGWPIEKRATHRIDGIHSAQAAGSAPEQSGVFFVEPDKLDQVVNRRRSLALTQFWCSSDYSAPISLA